MTLKPALHGDIRKGQNSAQSRTRLAQKMTGAFGPDVGVYTAASDSPLRQFYGWVWGATSDSPRPIDGTFEWKNGDVFTGSIDGSGSQSRGIYAKADGQARFTGIVDLSESDFHPVEGILENSSGRLLAVVRRKWPLHPKPVSVVIANAFINRYHYTLRHKAGVTMGCGDG